MMNLLLILLFGRRFTLFDLTISGFLVLMVRDGHWVAFVLTLGAWLVIGINGEDALDRRIDRSTPPS